MMTSSCNHKPQNLLLGPSINRLLSLAENLMMSSVTLFNTVFLLCIHVVALWSDVMGGALWFGGVSAVFRTY